MALKTAVRVTAGVAGAAAALSAVVGGGAALLESPVVWFLVLFQAATLVGGVMAGLAGLGKFRESPAVALACAGGTVLGGAVLGYVSSHAGFGAFDLKLLLIAQVACAAAVLACAAAAGLGKRSMKPLLIGAVLGGAGVGVVGAAWVLRDRLAGLPEGVLYPGAILGFVLVTGLLSAGAHLVIGAFSADGERGAA